MSKKSGRLGVLRFLCLSAALQFLFLLFGTCGALERLLPVYIHAVSDNVSLGDDSYTEFFPIRQYMAETPVDVIVIGVDYSYAETYLLLTDLIAALKNDINIGTICVDAYPGTMGMSAVLLSARDEETRQNTTTQMKERFACSDAFCTFLMDLSRMKEEYPPQRQFSGGTMIAGSEGDSRWEEMVASLRVYKKRTERPVLLLTDTRNLRVNEELRTLLRDSSDLNSMCIQCHYSSETLQSGKKTPEVKLLEQGKMDLFDELYSDAAKKADGRYPDFRFSEIFTTEISFLMYNCTPDESVETEEAS